jgi:hypothetical protein
MKIIIACEFSGIVREAFREKGHNAWSCDFLESEIPGNHIKDNIFNHLNENWDMMIYFYPCTNLAVSGARWFKYKKEIQQQDINNFIKLYNCNIRKIAGENPISILSTAFRKPDQIIQPWMFGHGETKATCLWLKNLPKLKPENIVPGRIQRIHNIPPSSSRWKIRSRTFQGIADAMANQWG